MHSRNKHTNRIITFVMALFVMAFFMISPAGANAAKRTKLGKTVELTENEMKYIETHATLKIGYVTDYMPFCSSDDNGNVRGVIVDIFREIIDGLGINDRLDCVYKCYNSFRDMEEGLKAGEIDVSFPVIGETNYLSEMRIAASNEVLNVPMYVAYVGEYTDSTFDRIASNTRPLMKVTENYPNSEIVQTGSATESLDAVVGGRADCTIMASYRLRELLNEPQYRNIKTLPFGVSMSYCIGVGNNQPELMELLNKGIQNYDDAVILDYVYRYIEAGSRYTAEDFIRDNSLLMLIMAFVIIGIIITIGLLYLHGVKSAQRKTVHQLEVNKQLTADKEEQLKKITQLNSSLQDKQTELEGLTAEQELRIDEIGKLNHELSLKENELSLALDRIGLIAALSIEYEAIHLVDLDNDTFTTMRESMGMSAAEIPCGELPYHEAINQLVNTFVVPEERKDFLEFLSVERMKARMEISSKFTYRYSIVADYSNRIIYEMTFVCAGEDPKQHKLVIGTRCVDDLLRFEREEDQYTAALLHDCLFFYEFNVTTGNIDGEFNTSNNYDPLHGYEMSFPMSYDVFNSRRTELLGMTAATEKEQRYWTCEGLIRAYQRGKRSVEIRYSSEKLKLSWNASIILMEDMMSHHLHAVYICKDVTDVVEAEKQHQRELEKALEEAKRATAAKTDFLSRMSHDIRTPLNGIIGIMEINEKHKDDAELVNANRKKAKIAADHLLSLINDVLDMNKLDYEETELPCIPFNLLEVCRDVLTVCGIRAKEAGIIAENDGGINLIYPNVYGSPLHLRQVLMNLQTNAIKYNKPGGSISSTSQLVSYDGEQVVYDIIVKDTGIGMSEEFIKHLYEPFTQERNDARSRYQGTGMGMAIVKSLIEKMNGKISVESRVGVGTTFVVTIPFKINHDNIQESSNAESLDGILKDLNILVVEDNELNLEIAQTMLEDAGAVITTAENGQMAVEVYRDRPAGSFDAILMDVMMPVMNGYEATKQIRSMNKADSGTVPIIAMSANAFADDVQKALSSGMNAHLSKPLSMEVLMKTIANYVNR